MTNHSIFQSIRKFSLTIALLIPLFIIPNPASASVANPTVSGPIACGVNGISCSQASALPLTSATTNPIIGPALAAAGYTEKEFFVEGTASAYTTSSALTGDGIWNAIAPSGLTSAYKTRILVRYPTDPKKFNGTVIVEWFNVSLGFDTDPQWTLTYSQLLKDGFAFVGVSAQLIGVDNLRNIYDPLRYASLNHPGDSFSYDILSQVTQAIRSPVGLKLLNALKIKKIIATGLSQSGNRLATYFNAVQPLTNLFDGYLISGRGRPSSLSQPPQPSIVPPVLTQYRTDLNVPLINVQSEQEIGVGNTAYYTRQDDHSLFRQWEIAGASHLNAWEAIHQSSGPIWWSLNPCSLPINDGLPQHYVMNAAVYHLNKWLKNGTQAPVAPRLAIATPPTFPTVPTISRDSYGNAIGGIRTPLVDVPIATYSGQVNPPGGLCGLLGSTVPFDSATLSTLYPTHSSYVDPFTAATSSARDAGFLTQPDAAELLKSAQKSDIGS